MSKNRDLFQILILVLIAMFIPFFISVIINFEIDFSNFEDILKIIITFIHFLIIFGIELIVVFIYFNISNKLSNNKINKIKKIK
jgi:hypothetical protein